MFSQSSFEPSIKTDAAHPKTRVYPWPSMVNSIHSSLEKTLFHGVKGGIASSDQTAANPLE